MSAADRLATARTLAAPPRLMSNTPDAVVECYCTVEQVAERLQVSVDTIERECAIYEATKGRDGLGPRYKFGRLVRLKVGDVNAFIARHRVA